VAHQLGVGVIGLHEGRTLLVGLTQPVPPVVGQTSTSLTRVLHGRAVVCYDLHDEKIEETRRDCPALFYTTTYDEMLAHPAVDIVAISPDIVI